MLGRTDYVEVNHRLRIRLQPLLRHIVASAGALSVNARSGRRAESRVAGSDMNIHGQVDLQNALVSTEWLDAATCLLREVACVQGCR